MANSGHLDDFERKGFVEALGAAAEGGAGADEVIDEEDGFFVERKRFAPLKMGGGKKAATIKR